MTPPTVVVITLTPDELRSLVSEAVRAAFAEHVPPSAPPQLLDKRGLAEALAVSSATITRMDPPVACYVGASPRYALDEVRAWLAQRGKVATKTAPAKREVITGVRLLSRGRR